ncbi:glycosyltransferase [Aliishimia ponticola]|uniref:Glycosyltransferase n=1 Tax=Aliishimia ponticola TaxID=2499833 RepID=A0A4S4NM69_9RHOB|nr:glycosyltransferase [Aliishimia ponticola]THH37320.1 glycosyltransferase [Aliishimia ponticola]
MPAPISVVIPTLNAAGSLPGCADALMEGVREGLIRELIVTDGGSRDATQDIADEIGANWISGPPSRGGQLARGCAAARSDWLLVVHADTQLMPGWTGKAVAHLKTGKAGWGQLRFDQGGAWVAGWANLRSQVFGLPYGDQALLLPRRLYQSVGGYADQPLMEDVALARALRGQLRPAGFTAVTSAAKYRKQGWLRRGARNLWCLAGYFAGISPERLAAIYRR